jgi:hypothetical protein
MISSVAALSAFRSAGKRRHGGGPNVDEQRIQRCAVLIVARELCGEGAGILDFGAEHRVTGELERLRIE